MDLKNMILIVSLLAGMHAGVAAPLSIVLTDDVQVPSVKRLGMNIADSWWDAGTIAQKRTVYNFEGTMYRSIFWGPKQDAHGLYTWQNIMRPPEEYLAVERVVGASFRLLNGPAKGMTGVVAGVEKRVYDDGHQKRELDYLIFDREVPEHPGNDAAVMVEKDGLHEGHINVVSEGKSAYWLSQGAQLVQGDTAPESLGKTALKLDGSTKTAHIRLPGKSADFAEVRGDWTLTFRAKAIDGEPSIHVVEPQRAEAVITPEWSDYAFSFSIGKTHSSNLFTAMMEIKGGVVLLDDLVFTHGGQNNPTAFNDVFVDTLKAFRPGILRFLQMGGSTLENAVRPVEEKFRFTSSPWMRGGPFGGPFKHAFSMHEFYALCAEVGAAPWFSLPGVLHQEELEQFLEYVAAPADTGFGALRAAWGQEEPWSDVFDEIIIEFGNEAWNQWGPFMAGGYSGPEYWFDLIEAGKQSVWYRTNMVFSSAGQNVNHWINTRIADQSRNADQFAIATYLIHRLDPEVEEALGSDDASLYHWLFGYADDYLIHHEGMKANAATRDTYGMELAVYETNHHASDGDASSAFRNRFLTSLGGGLNIALNMLTMLQEHGARRQCFFTMFGSENNAYKVKDVRLFGAVLTLLEDEVRVRPHWLALQMANRVMEGDLMKVTFDGDMPTILSPVYESRERTWSEPVSRDAVRAFPFQNGKQHGLIILNLHVESPADVLLALGHAVRGQTARMEQLAGEDINAHNELEQNEPQVEIASYTLEDFRDGYRITLPPHSMTTLRWQAE